MTSKSIAGSISYLVSLIGKSSEYFQCSWVAIFSRLGHVHIPVPQQRLEAHHAPCTMHRTMRAESRRYRATTFSKPFYRLMFDTVPKPSPNWPVESTSTPRVILLHCIHTPATQCTVSSPSVHFQRSQTLFCMHDKIVCAPKHNAADTAGSR